ncbi:unnamed protein product, partial [Effrenium voratum]
PVRPYAIPLYHLMKYLYDLMLHDLMKHLYDLMLYHLMVCLMDYHHNITFYIPTSTSS